MPSFGHPSSSADLSDHEVEALKRLGFAAALRVLGFAHPSIAVAGSTTLDALMRFAADQGVADLVSRRFAVAQAAFFIHHPDSFADYVPPRDVHDAEWLRFMVEDRKATDLEIAFQIGRCRRRAGAPDVWSVASAREALGLPGNISERDQDTLDIFLAHEGQTPSARDFLGVRAWLARRVLLPSDMSDGDIAKDLTRVGVPCDRSTVRVYRNQHKLRRGTWLEAVQSGEEESDA